jgi:anaerobic ribonucleoside-triphosphate reductase activating protein
MNFSKIDPMSIVDGEGCRVTLFVSGCRNHCPGCFNEATWDFAYGKEFTDIEVNEIITACSKPYMAGLTILGGEPFEEENQPAVLDLMRKFHEALPEKNIWVYTGYVVGRDLRPGGRKWVLGVTNCILDLADVIVDGPFIKEKRDLTLRFRGSSNQRILYKKDGFLH